MTNEQLLFSDELFVMPENPLSFSDIVRIFNGAYYTRLG